MANKASGSFGLTASDTPRVGDAFDALKYRKPSPHKNAHQGDTQEGGDAFAAAWLKDAYMPPEAAIRAGGNCIGAAELQAMVQEELHPDDLALRIWYAMRPAIAKEHSAPKPVAEASEPNDKALTAAYASGRADEREEWAPVLEALDYIVRRLRMDIDGGSRPDKWSMEDMVRKAKTASAKVTA